MTWSREDLESFRRSEAIDEAHGVSYRRSDEQWELLRSPVHPPVHPSCPLCDAQPARAAQPYTAVRSDVLAEIAPADYVEALCGVELPHHGMINCRLPGHEDGTPSFKVYPDARQGWYCFGCARGGTIFDLGVELWGMGDRGTMFLELRRRLARELLRA